MTFSPSCLAKHAPFGGRPIVWDCMRHASASGMQICSRGYQMHGCDELTCWSMTRCAWNNSSSCGVRSTQCSCSTSALTYTTPNLHTRCMGFLFVLVWRPLQCRQQVLLASLDVSWKLNSELTSFSLKLPTNSPEEDEFCRCGQRRSPSSKSKGTAGDDDFAVEAHAALRGNVAGSSGKAGGSDHHRAMVTHDAPVLLAPAVKRMSHRNGTLSLHPIL